MYSGERQYTFREVFLMKKKKYLFLSLCFLTAFAAWTAAVRVMDVQSIGPEQSEVGFAELNGFVHALTGVHMGLYVITDWLSLIPLLFAAGFALLGLTQWIHRKSICKVDCSLLRMGSFYLATGSIYLFFENYIINYRPVLIEGVLEASYPSSTTMLVICVMSTAALQLKERISHCALRKWVVFLIHSFTVLMVIGRLLSGVHWFTDIVGGILISIGLVMLYCGQDA